MSATTSDGSSAAVSVSNTGGEGINISAATIGVRAVGGNTSYGVEAIGYEAVVGQSKASGDYPFVGLNESGNVVWYVDDGGTAHTLAAPTALGITRHGYYAESYSAQTTSRTIEDVGSAQLVGGSAIVHIDPSFAETIDPSGYAVFLTPNGDSKGLYVTSKGAASFVVHENQGGRSTLAFDYRIVAHPYSHASERLRVASSVAAFGWPAPVDSSKTNQLNAAVMKASSLRNSAARFSALRGPASALGARPGATQYQAVRPAIEAQLSHLR